MKISVNKDAAALAKENTIKDVLEQASIAAQKGLNSFTYHWKEGERNSFPPPYIMISIEDASEGTVKCGYRSDFGTHTKFFIK